MPAQLIDTNILVYAHDPGDKEKQQRAIEVLDGIHRLGLGRLSVQCLAEFFAASTRGPTPRLTEEQASLQVDRLVRSWPIYELTPLIVLEAVRGVRQYRLSYWDGQLWATARLNQVPIILSEDFQDGAVLEGIRFVNPFAEAFDLDAWLAGP